MAISPTQLSLKMMREQGYYAEVVERYNSFTRTRHDLLGFIDILCLKDGEIVGVQTTSNGHVSDRLKKILAHDNFKVANAAGIKVVVHGWAKVNNRWQVREVDVLPQNNVDDLESVP